jgi:hypothetical protein
MTFVLDKCFLWGTDWVLNYYLEEFRLQRIELLQISMRKDNNKQEAIT